MSTRPHSIALVLLTSLFSTTLYQSGLGQGPQPSPEHQVLKHDEGSWKAEIKMWMGPDGKPDPDAPPQLSTGTEKNRMLGPYWCLSEFEGNFGGMEFQGHSVIGYDEQKKKYVGSWVDSISPNTMHMLGTFDKKTKTMTHETTGMGMEGQEVKGKMEVVYTDDDHHTMTMYSMIDGKAVKTMQIVYSRMK